MGIWNSSVDDGEENDVSRETPTGVDPNPTPEQAMAMFADRPGLASIETTDGLLSKDGTLVWT